MVVVECYFQRVVLVVKEYHFLVLVVLVVVASGWFVVVGRMAVVVVVVQNLYRWTLLMLEVEGVGVHRLFSLVVVAVVLNH